MAGHRPIHPNKNQRFCFHGILPLLDRHFGLHPSLYWRSRRDSTPGVQHGQQIEAHVPQVLKGTGAKEAAPDQSAPNTDPDASGSALQKVQGGAQQYDAPILKPIDLVSAGYKNV
jgi:hypothetical protein